MESAEPQSNLLPLPPRHELRISRALLTADLHFIWCLLQILNAKGEYPIVLWRYLLKATTVGSEKQPLQGSGPCTRSRGRRHVR
jgi:hypothetical protein